MLELFIIRHGRAGKSLEDQTMDDKRSLKKKGKEEVRTVAKGLKKLHISFDLVLTSPLPRAKESAEIVYAHCGAGKTVRISALLSPGASYHNLVKYLNRLKNVRTVAIVGHEPFLSGFASFCLSNSKASFLNLKKAGMLKLEIPDVIRPGKCVLAWLMEPHHLA